LIFFRYLIGFALGIEAEILFRGFSPIKRLQRKAWPRQLAGNAHQKNKHFYNIEDCATLSTDKL